MQRKFLKNLVFVFGLLSLVMTLNSCDYDDNIAITEPTRYTYDDVKSYADLFKVFWTVMDQRYSCFYEQKERTNMDWDAVYNEYYPKFSALKTFGRSREDNEAITADRNKAIQYFESIINPIIDRHFFVAVNLPKDNNGTRATESFYGGMDNQKANVYNFKAKLGYIKRWLSDDAVKQTYKHNVKNDEESFTYVTGSVKNNPEIYYLTYDKFAVNFADLKRYLNHDYSLNYNTALSVSDIENHPVLNAISDKKLKDKIKELSIKVLSQWDSFKASAELKTFQAEISKFMATEEVSDVLVQAAKKLKSKKLADYNNVLLYHSVLTTETEPYIEWFVSRMNQHTNKGDGVKNVKKAALAIIDKAPFYQNFLNPLHQGKIKKLILDLRDNGGGYVLDFDFFTGRFVTKNTVWSYERTKEGNGRFDYTPWVPQKTKRHPFGIPSDIPIAVLTDNGSVSMSEATTLLIKSQGPQNVSIGDYSYGGLATITDDPDDFNGGMVGKVASNWFYFYMPVSAVKGANGEIVEGIGIKPDIYVEPPTDAEVDQMEDDPDTFTDRVMEAAVDYLSSK